MAYFRLAHITNLKNCHTELLDRPKEIWHTLQYQKKNLLRYNPKLYISRLALNSISSSYLDTLMYTKIQKLCSKILISQVILNFQTDLVII